MAELEKKLNKSSTSKDNDSSETFDIYNEDSEESETESESDNEEVS